MKQQYLVSLQSCPNISPQLMDKDTLILFQLWLQELATDMPIAYLTHQLCDNQSSLNNRDHLSPSTKVEIDWVYEGDSETVNITRQLL